MGETASETRRRLAITAVVALLGVACEATTSSPPPSHPTSLRATGSPIRIGVIDDTGAPSAIEDAELRVDTDLAVDEVNASGGIDGHPLLTIYSDARGDASAATGIAQQLVQVDGADVLVGGISSAECVGIQNLAPQLQTVYLPSTGCLSEDFTGSRCNAYSFRVSPVGRQIIFPLSAYLVRTYGRKWAVVYSDDADGQSQAVAYGLGLQRAGGALAQKIAIPVSETNVTPYIAKIPTNGSVMGVIEAQAGAEVVPSLTAMEQLGIGTRMPVVGIFGKERWEGTYPDVVNGSLVATSALSDSPQDNQYDVAYHAAFRRQLAREDPSLRSTLGPVDTAVPGISGYQAYTTITALKLGMIASGFTRRADAQKLITALANLKAAPGVDFPAGAFAMRKSDHQGTMSTYIAKVTGQTENVVATVAPAGLPAIGNCQAR
jgi:branched-chain amino acid transport system substrate-binding protein